MRSAWIGIFLIVLLGARAQGPELRTSLDTAIIRIGEQAHLSIQLRDLKGNEQIVWPELKDTLSRYIEVVDPGYPDSLGQESGMSMEMMITITAWDSGQYVIRPLKVIVDGQEMLSKAYLFQVQTMEVDTTNAPLDIKPIMEEPFSLSDWLSLNWPYLIGALAILAILWLIFKLRRTKKGTIIPVAAEPEEDPLEVILRKLKRLKDDKAWSRGDIKEFYVSITDLLRDYLELRYRINAHELTSSQIIEAMRAKGISSTSNEGVRGLLWTADMVKFAKEQPTEIIAIAHLDEVISYVTAHRAEEEKDNKPS
jgi:hypothetical protein